MGTEAIVRTALSFFIAGTWISLASLFGERLGSRVGGLITNLPSNILISFIFIALTKGVPFTAEAARAIPLGMAINTLFIFVFIMTIGNGLGKAVGYSLAAWLAAALPAAAFPVRGIAAAFGIYAAVCLAGFVTVEFAVKIRSVPKRLAPFSPGNIAFRALFAGTVVASAVLIAQISPPYITGLVVSFPAVMLSTLVILSRTQGADFTRGTGKILLLSSSNIIVYAFAVAFFYPALGIPLGTLASFACALAWISLFLPIARRLR
jgi:uncharacterized membrane protein (GlpM family)